MLSAHPRSLHSQADVRGGISGAADRPATSLSLQLTNCCSAGRPGEPAGSSRAPEIPFLSRAAALGVAPEGAHSAGRRPCTNLPARASCQSAGSACMEKNGDCLAADQPLGLPASRSSRPTCSGRPASLHREASLELRSLWSARRQVGPYLRYVTTGAQPSGCSPAGDNISGAGSADSARAKVRALANWQPTLRALVGAKSGPFCRPPTGADRCKPTRVARCRCATAPPTEHFAPTRRFGPIGRLASGTNLIALFGQPGATTASRSSALQPSRCSLGFGAAEKQCADHYRRARVSQPPPGRQLAADLDSAGRASLKQ